MNSVVLYSCSLIHHLHSTGSPSSKSLISIFQFYNFFFCITSIYFLLFFVLVFSEFVVDYCSISIMPAFKFLSD